MGFIMKASKIGSKLGEGFLKYGTAFIPGVGPLLAAGINAGTNIADTKIKGGSWSDALKSGAIGGATGYMGGGAGSLAKASKFGKILGAANMAAPLIGEVVASRSRSDGSTSGIGPSAVPRSAGGVMPRGGYSYDENPMTQLDQSSPNLAQSIFQGRNEAIKNQPFRKGYDIKTITGYEDDDETKPTYSVSRMPRITSDIAPRKKRKAE